MSEYVFLFSSAPTLPHVRSLLGTTCMEALLVRLLEVRLLERLNSCSPLLAQN